METSRSSGPSDPGSTSRLRTSYVVVAVAPAVDTFAARVQCPSAGLRPASRKFCRCRRNKGVAKLNPEARSPKPEARSPKPEARSPKPEARSPKPEARNPKPETRNPKPEANKKPVIRSTQHRQVPAASRSQDPAVRSGIIFEFLFRIWIGPFRVSGFGSIS